MPEAETEMWEDVWSKARVEASAASNAPASASRPRGQGGLAIEDGPLDGEPPVTDSKTVVVVDGVPDLHDLLVGVEPASIGAILVRPDVFVHARALFPGVRVITHPGEIPLDVRQCVARRGSTLLATFGGSIEARDLTLLIRPTAESS